MAQELMPFCELCWAGILIMLPISGITQNLVPNPSFEEYTECPDNYNLGEPLECVPWNQGSQGSADFFHTCATPGNAGVPDNVVGYQWPVSGEGYTGVVTRGYPDYSDCREYIMAPLNAPLIAGEAYLVSFYVSVADLYCPTIPFGALFTVDPPIPLFCYHLPYVPQIEANGGFLGNHTDWTLISRCFVADGGERYITLGNFRNYEDSPVDTACDGITYRSYYYIDSVSVIQMPSSFDQFVLDPAEGCGSYTIFPGQAENYFWSDSTTNPTLTVTESGIYYVTLSNACDFSMGEIEVTIIPDSPPVGLGNDTLLCIGESLELSLDPDSGDYVWDDGSTGNEYLINTAGTYSVTLTDNCDVTSDTIAVSFLEIPGPFSLGADTSICDGNVLVLSPDTLLGDFIWQDGSTVPTYIIDEAGEYALTITNMCGQAVDEISVDIVEPPDFSIGPADTILCEGDSIVISLDPDLGTFTWHDNSSQTMYTIFTGGIVSVVVTNTCFTTEDEMSVIQYSPPEFTLGPDITVCESGLPVLLDLSNVQYAEEYLWGDGSEDATYWVNSEGLHSVTVSNICFSVVDNIDVILSEDGPIVTLPADQLLCPGDSMLLDAGGVQGEYLWLTSTGSVTTADTFLVTEPGTYSLQVTNICGTGSDTIVIDYTAVLSPPDLGVDFSLCPGETTVLYAGMAGVSYAWSDTSTGSVSDADSLLISEPGVFVLEVSDQCGSASDTVVVTQNGNPPSVDLPESLGLCEGDTVVINSGVSGVQYQWNTQSDQSSIPVYEPGEYSLTVTNACGSDADTVVVLDLGSAPIVDLGADTSICMGDSVILDPGLSGVGYLWQDGSVDARFIAHLQGTYYVQVSNQCGTATDTMIVSDLGSAPILDLGADTTICPGDSVILDPGLSGVDYLWNDGSVDTRFIAYLPDIYYLQVSNICGRSSDTIEVTTLDPIPDLDLGADQSLCPGETITIDPGILGVDYLWQDGTTETQYIASLPGMVILTISNACGAVSDTIEIILDPNGPDVDLGPDVLACEGDSVTLDPGISGVAYLWNDGSVHTRLVAYLPGIYYVQVSNACGMDSDTILVNIHGTVPAPSLGPDTTLCEGEVLTLVSDADVETTIEWLDVATGSVVSTSSTTDVTIPGIYVLSEANHCGTATDTIAIDFESAPVAFELGDDMVICPGDTVFLNAPQTDNAILWETPDGTSTESQYFATLPGVVTLTMSNHCGVVSDEILIEFDENEPQITFDPISLCDGESVILDATQPFDAIYEWNTGSTAPSIQITTPGNYSVSIITECHTTESNVQVTYSADCDPQIFIPNVFSPNGDGVNDVWEISIDPAIDITGIECSIFDRWGNTVFYATSIPAVWDGRFNGKDMGPGVYVYVVKFIRENDVQVMSGGLTLVQ